MVVITPIQTVHFSQLVEVSYPIPELGRWKFIIQPNQISTHNFTLTTCIKPEQVITDKTQFTGMYTENVAWFRFGLRTSTGNLTGDMVRVYGY
jgi:hypothetical protein